MKLHELLAVLHDKEAIHIKPSTRDYDIYVGTKWGAAPYRDLEVVKVIRQAAFLQIVTK